MSVLGSTRYVPMLIAAGLLVVVAVAAFVYAPLTVFNALAPADPGATIAQSNVAYGADPRQRLDVYVPERQSGGRPIVVVFYGGSWNSGRKEDYAFLGKALASRGFVAFIADYRLVPEVIFPAFLEDSAQTVRWAQTNGASFGGDPKRLFLLGHSAGAYIAAMIALDRRYLEGVGTSPAALAGVAALSGPYDFLPLDAASTKAAFGQVRDLDATQPINFVSPDAPPMLLATGDADTTVKPRNSRELAERLSAAGARVTTKVYPGIGHIGIMLALSVLFRGRAPVLDDVTAFIAEPRS